MEQINYCEGGIEFNAQLLRPSPTIDSPPLILIAHTALGLSSFECDTARQLAAAGYAALAVDLYGNGRHFGIADKDEALQLMGELMADRLLLRRRIRAALAVAAELPGTDSQRTAAIGFCFGGLTVIELVRSGAALAGAVGFHALLTRADPPLPEEVIRTPLLMLHGERDPLVPPQQVLEFQSEMQAAEADWQMISYGQAGHSFSMPHANDSKGGYVYHQPTAERAWQACHQFLREVFRH